MSRRWILDDGAARRCAAALDIPVLGTLGVLIVAKQDGHISRVRPLAKALIRSGLHIDEAVLNQALQLAGEA